MDATSKPSAAVDSALGSDATYAGIGQWHGGRDDGERGSGRAGAMALNSRSAALSAKARVAPQIDADDTADHGGPEDPDVIGGLFYLEYRDGKGQESARDIVLRRVI
ncbi:UNVERIFIED_ORG: hypothetical protein ABID33_002599 [Xanthobacter viscosus]|nr:hypothetical protein [Xanthobacter autotrophicus]